MESLTGIEIRRKVFGYFIRYSPGGEAQLLALAFAKDPGMPLRFPGGNLETGEDPIAGLHREIYEETGITNFRILRRLGIQRYYKERTHAWVERHDFLIQAEASLPDTFTVTVQGAGGDAGMLFQYEWITQLSIPWVDEEFRAVVTPEYLPEFFSS